jgi:hypothetical protein
LGSLTLTFALATVVLSMPLAADLTFAQYFQANGSQQQWAITTAGDTTTITAGGAVYFTFSGVPGFSGPELATFAFSAASETIGTCATNTCANGESFTQAGYYGSFSFTDAGSDPGTNLLSGTFQVIGTGAQFSSEIGSAGGSFDASATAADLNQLVLESDFISFAGQTDQNASWGLSSLVPDFAIGAITAGQAYPSGTFDASATGTFSSSPMPEPSLFVPLAAGVLALGFRRRKRIVRRVNAG